MAVQLDGFAQLTPRQDADAMADALVWVAEHPAHAHAQALRGREYVLAEWSRQKAFGDLKRTGAVLWPICLSHREGHYARKQIFSRDRLVAWSHRRRFATALTLVEPFAGKRVLDYGCGDGTFLALSLAAARSPAAGIGAELSHHAVADCLTRYRDEPRLQFVHVSELNQPGHVGQYVRCSAWSARARRRLGSGIDRLEQCLAPGGALIISVPVETGLPLLVKQTVRRIAGWRGIGHYPGTSSYSWVELGISVVAGARTHIARPVFDAGTGPVHDHKGFNWMVLWERLGRLFRVVRALASPFTWPGPHLATQAWFVCRRR
jgi:SAM-dependent methyltransferase